MLADAAPVMIWLTGPDGACVFVGKPWLDFRGRSADQELGSGWLEGVHPDDRNVCSSTFLSAVQNRTVFHLEYRAKKADGTYARLIDTGVPRYEPDGSFAGYIGCAVEVEALRLNGRNGHEHSVVPVTNPLTCREQQVVTLIAEGKSTKEIAAILGISYKTADSHRTKIMEKLQVHETASLVRWVVRAGLVQP